MRRMFLSMVWCDVWALDLKAYHLIVFRLSGRLLQTRRLLEIDVQDPAFIRTWTSSVITGQHLFETQRLFEVLWYTY